MWKFHILAALDGNGLESYIDPDSEISSKFITVTEGTSSSQMINPSYAQWKRQDRLIV